MNVTLKDFKTTTRYHVIFSKMGQSRPLFVYFRPFHIPFQMTNLQFEQYELKKV